MKRIIFALCLSLMAGVLAGVAKAEDRFVSPSFILESYGVYCGPEGESIKQAAPGTVLGYITLTEAATDATVVTTRVPASLGISFGVSLRLAEGLGEQVAEFRVTHPTNIPGKSVTERWNTGFSANGPSLNRFSFDYPEELAQGRWTMEVVHRNGEVMFRQVFDVVAPDAAADILSKCSGSAPVS